MPTPNDNIGLGLCLVESSDVSTRGSDWANSGRPSSRETLPYNVEPKAWFELVFTALLVTI